MLLRSEKGRKIIEMRSWSTKHIRLHAKLLQWLCDEIGVSEQRIDPVQYHFEKYYVLLLT